MGMQFLVQLHVRAGNNPLCFGGFIMAEISATLCTGRWMQERQAASEELKRTCHATSSVQEKLNALVRRHYQILMPYNVPCDCFSYTAQCFMTTFIFLAACAGDLAEKWRNIVTRNETVWNSWCRDWKHFDGDPATMQAWFIPVWQRVKKIFS